MASSSETTMKKKLTGQAAGYLILAALVVASWAIFKILTPGNFGSPKNLVSYFEASLLAEITSPMIPEEQYAAIVNSGV